MGEWEENESTAMSFDYQFSTNTRIGSGPGHNGDSNKSLLFVTNWTRANGIGTAVVTGNRWNGFIKSPTNSPEID